MFCISYIRQTVCIYMHVKYICVYIIYIYIEVHMHRVWALQGRISLFVIKRKLNVYRHKTSTKKYFFPIEPNYFT